MHWSCWLLISTNKYFHTGKNKLNRKVFLEKEVPIITNLLRALYCRGACGPFISSSTTTQNIFNKLWRRALDAHLTLSKSHNYLDWNVAFPAFPDNPIIANCLSPPQTHTSMFPLFIFLFIIPDGYGVQGSFWGPIKCPQLIVMMAAYWIYWKATSCTLSNGAYTLLHVYF